MASHQWGSADLLDDPSNQTDVGVYGGDVGVFAGGYDDPVDQEPPDMAGYFNAFWAYTPAAGEHLHFTSSNTGFGPTLAGIWLQTGMTLTTLVAPTAADFDVDLAAASNYIIMAAFVDADADTQYGGFLRWEATLTTSVTPDVLDVPPVTMDVLVGARIPGEADELAVPPISLAASIGTPTQIEALSVPPVGLGLSVAASVSAWSGTVTLSAPTDGETVAVDQPNLTVAVDTDDPSQTYTVEIQYASDAVFTSPVSILADFQGADGGVIVTPASPLTASPTFWRARLIKAATPVTNWTATQSFLMDLITALRYLQVYWTVTPSAARPIHLWHVDPPGPEVGDTVTVYGQGFPASGTLTLGDTVLPTTSWARVPASTDNASDLTRVIDGDTVTPEHYEVTFVAPATDSPGDPLTLES